MDSEKVIKGINICLNRFHCGAECPYYDNSGCQEQLREDALAMLKEQDAVIRQLRLALDIAKGTCKGIKAGQ